MSKEDERIFKFMSFDDYQKLKFSSTWNDLMAIVERIELLGYIVMVTTHGTIIKDINSKITICTEDSCKLKQTRLAIDQFMQVLAST